MTLKIRDDAGDGGLGEELEVADALDAEAQNPLDDEARHPDAEVAAGVGRGLCNLLRMAEEREEPDPRQLYGEVAEEGTDGFLA